jgi:hypothetical protein
VWPTLAARDLASREGVDIRLYSVTYQVVEDIEKAFKGLLAPRYAADGASSSVRGPVTMRATSADRSTDGVRDRDPMEPAWSTFGPHAIGSERSAMVSSSAYWRRS